MAPSTLNDDSSVLRKRNWVRHHRRGGASGATRAARCCSTLGNLSIFLSLAERRGIFPESATNIALISLQRTRDRRASGVARCAKRVSKPRARSRSRERISRTRTRTRLSRQLIRQLKRVRARNRGRNRRDTASKSRVSVRIFFGYTAF
jgi:hypothetical protein